MSTTITSPQEELITCGGGKTYRKLRFETIDDALAEANRLADAERAGRLKQLGSWTLGQALGHLATWANFAFDGYPPQVRPPWLIRVILQLLLKNRIINKGMMPGMRIRRVEAGTIGIEVLPTEEGLQRYTAAMQRLRTSSPPPQNPIFGKMTHDQWIKINLRHAELHLGFLQPT